VSRVFHHRAVRTLTQLALIAAVVALVVVPVRGQTLGTNTIYAAGTDCTTAGACAVYTAVPQGSIAIQVSGTFTATLQFEVTTDAITWVAGGAIQPVSGAVVTNTTAPGLWYIVNVGYTGVRVRASAWSSGQIRVTAARGYASGDPPSSGSGASNIVQVDPNTLALRNPAALTTPQELRLNESYTDANNFKDLRFFLDPAMSLINGAVAPGWTMQNRSVIGGVDNGNYGIIRLSAKQISLKDTNNGSEFVVSNTGITVGPSTTVSQQTLDNSFYIRTILAQHAAQCWANNANAAGNRTLCLDQGDPGVMNLYNDGSLVDGISSATPPVPSGTWRAGDPGVKPTCDVTKRGEYWHDWGAAGVKDTIEICAKDASDAYAWRTVY